MARPVLKTPLCELLGIEYPILLAGMGGGDGFARAELAAAVSEAGGLGIIGAAGWTPEQIHDECEKVRSLTKKPFGIDILLPASAENPPANAAAIDPSYNAWAEGAIERLGLQAPPPSPAPTADGLTPRQRQDRQVEAIISEKPKLMAAGLGQPGALREVTARRRHRGAGARGKREDGETRKGRWRRHRRRAGPRGGRPHGTRRQLRPDAAGGRRYRADAGRCRRRCRRWTRARCRVGAGRPGRLGGHGIPRDERGARAAGPQAALRRDERRRTHASAACSAARRCAIPIRS